MDEAMVETVVEAVRGMSAEEIEAMIRSSTNADAFGDPAMVAAFLVARTTSEA